MSDIKVNMNGKLHIETNGEQSMVEIMGKRDDVIFNWTALTYAICQSLGLSPRTMVDMLPSLLEKYQKDVLESIFAVDREALKGRKGGGKK